MSFFLTASQIIQNYGFEIAGSTYDPVFTKGYINSSPNVSIAGSSCFIDYSECYDNSDRTTLVKMFQNTPVGTTFALSNGDYYDADVELRRDISGVFSLQSLTGNNKLIIGGIVSGFTYDNTYTYYVKNNFVKPPQYSTTYSGATNSNWIKNNLNDSKFKSVLNKGILGSVFSKQEYVEIAGSTLNSGKLLVSGSLQLKDKKEIIYCGVTLTNENISSSFGTITQFIRGNSNPDILSKSTKTTGCYVVYNGDGNQVNCYEKQNELQAFLRSQYEGATCSTQWIVCDSCSRLSDSSYNAASGDKTFVFDAAIFAQIDQSVDTNGNPTATLLLNYPTSYVLRASSAISISINNGFKLDLSHPSLKGYAVFVYSEITKTNLISSNLYYLGTPGFDQASAIYVKQERSPRNLYIDFVGPVTLELNVQIG
jgi:hypothetical protein